MIETKIAALTVTQPSGWQQRKSAEMRTLILETVIDCLVENGYAALSIPQITQRAGISRGALHHHFATKIQLVAAVIGYIYEIRIQRFLDDFEQTGSVDVQHATDVYWDSVQTREYAACLELAIAARTDAELRAIYLPEARRYDRAWSEEMVKAFPQWTDKWAALQLASDFAAAAHMGLLLQRAPYGEKRLADVLRLINEVVGLIHARPPVKD